MPTTSFGHWRSFSSWKVSSCRRAVHSARTISSNAWGQSAGAFRGTSVHRIARTGRAGRRHHRCRHDLGTPFFRRSLKPVSFVAAVGLRSDDAGGRSETIRRAANSVIDSRTDSSIMPEISSSRYPKASSGVSKSPKSGASPAAAAASNRIRRSPTTSRWRSDPGFGHGGAVARRAAERGIGTKVDIGGELQLDGRLGRAGPGHRRNSFA